MKRYFFKTSGMKKLSKCDDFFQITIKFLKPAGVKYVNEKYVTHRVTHLPRIPLKAGENGLSGHIID